ncbi:MAG: DUF6514 family protein [Oscillospiraceae bacterium]|nr:DUF6514 family protein [Oscillospiraceae bacterium]
MERKHTRLIPSGSAEVNGAAVNYSVVVRDIFNCEGDAVGEIYGARVAGPDGFAEALDLTTRADGIFAFIEKLRACTVTPVTLRDVVCDALPL